MKLKDASAVLRGFDERVLMRWCRPGGLVRGPFQGKPGGPFWIPTVEVERLALEVLLVEPDWDRAP